ncbi:MAG: hypothetical protein JWN75_1109, partial [Candidatus Saccharibacteria bacterium]|nr:hypothetical protein [Candidatus Saccharibacteria bacterium]
MGFSLRNLVQGAKKTAGQVVHNVAPSTVAGVVNRNVAQPVNRAVVQPTTRLVSRAVDQANPLDNNRTWQQRTPTNNNSVKEQRNKAAYNIVAGTGVRAVRSVTGLAQMGSGLYDLASPGTGTSRVSQGLDKFAKFTDAKAKSKGVNTAYQATALPMELLGFKGVATGVGKAVSKGPKYVQNASKGIDKFVDAKTAGLSKKGPAGAIASSSLRGGFKVQNQVADKAFVAKFTGENASRGRDTSPKTVATDVLLGDLMNFGLPASGQAIRQGVKAVKPVTKAAGETAKKAKYNYDK